MTNERIRDNNVVIGLAVFCIKCMEPVRPATYLDMNGQTIDCKACGTHPNSAVGISVISDSYEMLHYAYDEMAKHKKMVNSLLSERVQHKDV
jgi:hypothetical protein